MQHRSFAKSTAQKYLSSRNSAGALKASSSHDVLGDCDSVSVMKQADMEQAMGIIDKHYGEKQIEKEAWE